MLMFPLFCHGFSRHFSGRRTSAAAAARQSQAAQPLRAATTAAASGGAAGAAILAAGFQGTDQQLPLGPWDLGDLGVISIYIYIY